MGAFGVLQGWFAGVRAMLSSFIPGRDDTDDLGTAIDRLPSSLMYLLKGERHLLVPWEATLKIRDELPGSSQILSPVDREMMESLLVLHQEIGDIVLLQVPGTDPGRRRT